MRDVGDMFACGSTARAVRQPQACEPLGKPGGSRAFSADDEYRRNAAEALCEPPAFGLRHFCEVTNGSEFVCLSGEADMRGSEFAVQINHSAARFGHGLAFDVTSQL